MSFFWYLKEYANLASCHTWLAFDSIPYNATFAWKNNMAWVTSESYKKIVEHFLRTGKVTLVSSERNFPVEGFAMAAFDSNPSKVRSEEFAKLSAYYGVGLANNVIFIGFFFRPFWALNLDSHVASGTKELKRQVCCSKLVSDQKRARLKNDWYKPWLYVACVKARWRWPKIETHFLLWTFGR